MQGILISVLFCIGLFALPVYAAEEALPLTPSEVEAKRAQAGELRINADTLRADADAAYRRDEVACRQSLLVNNCLLNARDRKLEKVEQARRIEAELAVLERELRRHKVAERRALRAKRQAEASQPVTVTVEGGPPSALTAEGLFNAPSAAPPKTPKKRQD